MKAAGHGYHFSVDGRQVSDDPWCNISCQAFQFVKDDQTNSWVVKGEYISWTNTGSGDSKSLSIKIFWRLDKEDGSLFSKYNIYVSKIAAVDGKTEEANQYLGVARVKAFYVPDLVVPAGISSLKFIIQVCGIDGAFQDLNSCPTFLLNMLKEVVRRRSRRIDKLEFDKDRPRPRRERERGVVRIKAK
ncbi:hypothetical protein BVC80_9093g151 [Macleaya cordata]|uniref:Cytosolic endo-beta-N-acetylglucosaminidase C-terminal domain-containing protein n=1 Tax=Macleaya cordata TaxID=56857 RepID=A0A200PXA8_MACCD|nr:hypothetical protein BVC80_9093g151 [Macleaya cordata]